jgi:hypothetical protein
VAGQSACLARLAVVSAPEPARSQWAACARATLALVPQEAPRPRLLLGGSALYSYLGSSDLREEPALAIVSPATLREYFDIHWRVGLAFLCLDEAADAPAKAPSGHAWGAKPLPTVLRLLAASSDLAALLRPGRGVRSLGRGNLLRGLLLGERAAWGGDGALSGDRDTWRRVALAELSPALQRRLAIAAAAAGPRALRVVNVRLGRTFVQDHLCLGYSCLKQAAHVWVDDRISFDTHSFNSAFTFRGLLEWLLSRLFFANNAGMAASEAFLESGMVAVTGPDHKAACSAARATLGDSKDRLHDLRKMWDDARSAPCACAACGARVAMRDSWVCGQTGRYFCGEACAGARLATPADEAELRDMERCGTRLSVQDALRWAAEDLAARGALHVVVSVAPGSEVPECPGPVHQAERREAWAASAQQSFLVVQWDTPLAGMDLAAAQAFITVDIPPDERELYSRAVRVGGGPAPLEVIRLLPPERSQEAKRLQGAKRKEAAPTPVEEAGHPPAPPGAPTAAPPPADPEEDAGFLGRAAAAALRFAEPTLAEEEGDVTRPPETLSLELLMPAGSLVQAYTLDARCTGVGGDACAATQARPITRKGAGVWFTRVCTELPCSLAV